MLDSCACGPARADGAPLQQKKIVSMQQAAGQLAFFNNARDNMMIPYLSQRTFVMLTLPGCCAFPMLPRGAGLTSAMLLLVDVAVSSLIYLKKIPGLPRACDQLPGDL